MPVGGFPGLGGKRRRTIRAPINPIDKSTVISIFPKPIKSVKNTITPGIFHLEAGTYDKPAFLIVGPSSWWKEVDEEQPLLEIPCGSHQVAEAIVKDFCNGMVGSNMSTSMPGLFWIPGEVNLITLQTTHKKALDNARDKQDKYFFALIKLADSFWARTNGNPLCINDEMRMAANHLNMKEKEWMANFTMMEKVNCKACGSPANPNYPVCSVCRAIINPELARERGIVFAEGATPFVPPAVAQAAKAK